ncbi:4-formylbenzenesulfonate dehydrogenase TsaC1/TsaC2 [compost metagenome]
MVRCIANEFGACGIRANSISPGLTETPMTAEAMATPGVAECFTARYPLGRLGSKADIANAAVWLAGDECFMTGENLQINGGLLLRGNPSGADVGAAVTAALARQAQG